MAIQNNLKIRDSACISQPHRSAIKVQPNLFSCLEIFKAQKFSMGFLGVNFGPGFFWVLLEALGNFWGFDFWPHSIISAA